MINQDGGFEDLEFENLPPGQRTYERNLQMQQNSANNPEIDADGNQKTYVCNDEECGKVFFDQGKRAYPNKNLNIGSYRKHQMTHGERLYICKVATCGKRFLDNSKLKRH